MLFWSKFFGDFFGGMEFGKGCYLVKMVEFILVKDVLKEIVYLIFGLF